MKKQIFSLIISTFVCINLIAQIEIKLYYVKMTWSYYGDIPRDSILEFPNVIEKNIYDTDAVILKKSFLDLAKTPKMPEQASFDHRAIIEVWDKDKLAGLFYMNTLGMVKRRDDVYDADKTIVKILCKYIPDLNVTQKKF